MLNENCFKKCSIKTSRVFLFFIFLFLVD